ncbi:Lhr-like helicase [Aciduliprofundum sp. MAR08-339]|uniref:DEAD/DEAH box helicase n=1 Tax=Aciduliprofundum sp. (strain MAR08-339) TaxID=673860 RepID=UPI0002A4B061|nr:Lhr-like helicase [Aciduliprofundum sp. MAR08-339]
MITAQKELKLKLKRTWTTFFGRFGKLLPIQEKAIPLILKRKNAIIVSSTASGKTEAVVAPLIERLLNENWKGLSILYVCPTRALVNDMYYRLKEQLEELNVSLSLKTGDKPQFNPDKLPDFLITTPESLDSLICRYPSSFKNLKAVILDEIHLIDNTYRGDQLRLLLRRLEYIAETDFNMYALSATIADPESVGSRYLKDFEVIIASAKREIKYTLVKSLREVFDYAREEKLKKLLIFCNKRANVENVAKECKRLWGNDIVVVHHGSLSKQIRKEAESFMKETQYGVCVATMTLEVGIDIGDIDAIVLAEIPWSISSLLQRIGRGNRRTQKCRVFAIFSSEEERAMFERMFKVAIEGLVEPVEYSPDLSVVVQQIFSSLYANPSGLESDYFIELFNGFCSEGDLKDILSHLETKGWIEKRYDKWYATTKLMDWGERGKIHSNIPSTKTLKVVDVSSKQIVGEVQYPIDDIFVLAGKVWKVVHVSGDKIYVKSEKSKALPAKFKSHNAKGYFYYFLPKNIRDKMGGIK